MKTFKLVIAGGGSTYTPGIVKSLLVQKDRFKLNEVWHLDVGSSHPGAEVGPKGMAVRHLKRYASWVQNVVRQFGPYPPRAQGS